MNLEAPDALPAEKCKTRIFARFQSSTDHLPEHIEGPFTYIQAHHGIMEAETPEGEFVIDFAALNVDGTWNAGPTSPSACGYTDVVFYAETAESGPSD